MSKKNSYSLLNLLAINVGTMVGVGIFFKNEGILTTTNNIWLALITWAIGSILVYGITKAFVEAASVTTRKGMSGTLANWISLFIGKKAGRLVHQLMSFQYYPIFSVMLAYYAVDFAFQAFEVKIATVNWAIVLGLTIGSFALLSIFNAFSYAFGKMFQMVGTFIKFIPLLVVVILGFFMPIVPAAQSTFGIVAGGAVKWKFATIALALPSVFFAFDGFFGGLALSKEERNKNDASKSSIYAVLLVGVFYMAFAAAVGFGTTDGNLFPLFEKTFSTIGARLLYMIISVSAMTVANGMMVAGARSLKNTADEKEFLPIGLITDVTKDGRFQGQTFLIFLIGSFYAVIWVLGSKLLGVGLEKLIDDFGNAITLLAYFAYALVGFGVYANRYSRKYKTEKTSGLGFVLISSFAVMLLIVINIVRYLFSYSKDPINASLIILAFVVIYICTMLADLAEAKK